MVGGYADGALEGRDERAFAGQLCEADSGYAALRGAGSEDLAYVVARGVGEFEQKSQPTQSCSSEEVPI